jgi:hypothetical protein
VIKVNIVEVCVGVKAGVCQVCVWRVRLPVQESW